MKTNIDGNLSGKDLALNLLIDLRITEFPIDLKVVLKNLGILVAGRNDFKYKIDFDDITYPLILNYQNIILTKNFDDSPIMRFSMAQSLGLIIAGFIENNKLKRFFSDDELSIAYDFANELLMPHLICLECNFDKIEDLATSFNIDIEAQKDYFKSIKNYINNNCHYFNQKEREYLNVLGNLSI